MGTAISDQGLVIRRITTHTAGGDPKRFFHSGVPVVDLLGTFTHYHSTLDTPENLNEESLEHAALAIAQLIESTDALSWDELAKGGVERPPLGDGSLPPGYIP
ncbi:MAG: hypothetical protein HXY25_03920 [Alphaproteobacteria bacterium]|nr:hypothetical protein [Alphaproteobacteria bacterium]